MEKTVVIDDGILIINDATANIMEASANQRVTGTMIFDYEVTINATKFINMKGITGRKPELPNLPIINVTDHKLTLSLPFLHEMNVRNLNHIDELKSQIIIKPIVSCIALMACIVFLYFVAKSLLHWRKKKALKKVKTEDGLQSRGGIVNNS